MEARPPAAIIMIVSPDDDECNDDNHCKNQTKKKRCLRNLQSGEYGNRDGVGGEERDEPEDPVHAALHL